MHLSTPIINLSLHLPPPKHLNQQYGSDVPLVLMNSFNTDEDTQKVIKKYQGVQVSQGQRSHEGKGMIAGLGLRGKKGGRGVATGGYY